MILANEEAQTRPYHYYVTVCALVLSTKQFVCLSVAMTNSQGNGYETQFI